MARMNVMSTYGVGFLWGGNNGGRHLQNGCTLPLTLSSLPAMGLSSQAWLRAATPSETTKPSPSLQLL